MDKAAYRADVLSHISPDEATRKKALATVEAVRRKIQDALDRDNITAEVAIGGSFAKDTWLEGDFDCDLFVRFDKGYEDELLCEMLYKHLPFRDIVRVHGSRDYFQFLFEGIAFEVVPTYLETEPKQAKNSTDISALHIEWLLGQKKKNPALSDEIRIAKQFCKARGAYGAESYLGGFSGHVLDILVAHYGSFEELLRAAEKWDKKELIDPNHAYQSKDEALETLNAAKIVSPIIVIDPILPTRNAAAALREERYALFRDAAKAFLSSKDPSMFTIPIFDPQDIAVHAGEVLYLLEAEPYHSSKDITGCRVLKVYQHLQKELAARGFSVRRSGWHFNYQTKSFIYLVLDDVLLSETVMQQGPPAREKAHAKAFREKYPNAREENGRYCAEIRRPYRDAGILLTVLMRDEYFKQRIRRATLATKRI